MTFRHKGGFVMSDSPFPGLCRGEISVFVGKTGTGKSIVSEIQDRIAKIDKSIEELQDSIRLLESHPKYRPNNGYAFAVRMAQKAIAERKAVQERLREKLRRGERISALDEVEIGPEGSWSEYLSVLRQAEDQGWELTFENGDWQHGARLQKDGVIVYEADGCWHSEKLDGTHLANHGDGIPGLYAAVGVPMPDRWSTR